jgi:xylulokinase
MRIKASVMNLTHHVIDAAEATALGAALLGGLGAGVYRDIDDVVGSMAYGQYDVVPDPNDVAIYESIYQNIYRRLYPAVAPLSQAISDLQAAMPAPEQSV